MILEQGRHGFTRDVSDYWRKELAVIIDRPNRSNQKYDAEKFATLMEDLRKMMRRCFVMDYEVLKNHPGVEYSDEYILKVYEEKGYKSYCDWEHFTFVIRALIITGENYFTFVNLDDGKTYERAGTGIHAVTRMYETMVQAYLFLDTGEYFW